MATERRSARGTGRAVRVLGRAWEPEFHAVKDFLARNRVPYEAVELGDDAEARELLARHRVTEPELPALIFPDGERLSRPSGKEIAAKLGFSLSPATSSYDLVIVGGGPAGLAAAVYGSSEGLRSIVVEREAPGGQAGMSSRIENYLGFPEGISGAELAQRAVAQAERFGAEILPATTVTAVANEDGEHRVRLEDGTLLSCRSLLIATGVSYRQLAVPGSAEFTGAGVYYGAASAEASSCQDHDVYLVGGGNSAGQAALLLARYARNVVLVTRDETLERSMSQYLVDRLREVSNIHVRTCSEVVRLEGERSLERVVLRRLDHGREETVATTRLFVWIGGTPHTAWLEGSLALDDDGFVLSGPDLLQAEEAAGRWPLRRSPMLLETSAPGAFVAGDARAGSVKRFATAVGEGAMAIQLVHRHLGSL